MSFAVGETTKLIQLTTIDDGAVEPNETVLVAIGVPIGTTIGTGTATGTIVDTPPPVLAVSGATIAEGGTLLFGVSRTGSTTGASTVSYSTNDDTAVAGADYTASSGTVTFAVGETSKTIVVTALSDFVVEGSETFTLTLASASGATIGTAAATGTITDVPPPVISVSGGTAAEGSLLSFTVTGSGPTTAASTVSYATSDGTAIAGSDYTAASGTLTFAAGEEWKTIQVTTLTDATIESSETLTLALWSPSGATLGTSTATGTIRDVPPPPVISVSGATAAEGSVLSFTVTRTGSTAGSSTVNYVTSNGTATAGTDYTATSGTLTFTAGQTSKTVSVTTLSDATTEPSETLTLTLSSPSGATLGTASASGTITDVPTSPVLSISSATASEGSPLVFTVTRTGSASGTSSVNYATSNGTAIAGSGSTGDYTPTSGTLTFAVGQTSRTVSVATLTDSLAESSETVTLTLSAPSGATLGTASATGTITDSNVPLVSVSNASASEGSVITFTFTRSGPTSGASSFSYNTGSAGTATAGADFIAVSGTLSFAAGETSKSVQVTTLADSSVESSETFPLVFSAFTNATLSSSSVTGTIFDVSPGPVLSVADATSQEGSVLAFTVTRAGSTSGPASANHATGSGSAVGSPGSAADYTSLSGVISFAAGETFNVIQVTTLTDALSEGSETMSLTLSAPSSGTSLSRAVAAGTITDVVPLPSISVSGATAAEGSLLSFTVTRSGSTTITSNVTYATSDGTAVAGSDYTAASGTLNFATGETSKAIQITTLSDAVAESSEGLTLTLSSPSGASLGTATASGTITDMPPPPVISAAGATANEGDVLSFVITRSGSTAAASTVSYLTSDGSATAGSDYTAASGSVTFAVGETSKTVQIMTIADSASEGNETLTRALSSPSGATIGTASAIGSITDGAVPAISISGATASEGNVLVFVITRTGLTTGISCVGY